MIETSLCVTSYNRPNKLREVLRSFFETNVYDLNKLELIIVDNGSTDKSVVDFIKSYQPACQYNVVLNEKNDYPNCLRFSKIQARDIAEGNFFIDCPDDHVFVYRTNWIDTCISRINNVKTVGSINYYAQPTYRFTKSNNTMALDMEDDNFFVASKKGYADFHVMSRNTYESIGEYDYMLGRRAESEYMTRSLSAGYFRNIMRYPVAICMDDGKFGEGNIGFELIKPIEEETYMTKLAAIPRKHTWKNWPIHNEALIEFCLREGYIRVRDE